MEKTLVVVYSYTGTSRRLAQLLCAQLTWPMGEIEEVRPRSGAWGLLRCVLDSLLHRRPAVRYAGPDPKDFDSVVLVSPIWAFRLASPMRSFVAQRADDLLGVSVISVMGNTGGANAAAEIARLLGRTPILSTAFTAREIDDGTCAARLEAFGKAIQAYGREGNAVRPAVWSPQTA